MDDKGYIDEATAIKATQTSERQTYDVVRQALKEVELDSSRRVELEDYVDVSGSRLTLETTLRRSNCNLSLVDRQTSSIIPGPEAHVYWWSSAGLPHWHCSS